ncbi:uncharacterized protein LOC130957608 [Arachis stenosperma]|uniref:uncharacterized protein LOC130957608 n=1 Tax=Arachis stenosperma TaxID=217475 RepID=UPI0025AD3FBB|nr:uncharacterized protein LOC130957608 [Arachis stenosperma]
MSEYSMIHGMLFTAPVFRSLTVRLAHVLRSSAVALAPVLLHCVCLPSPVCHSCSSLPICFNSALFSKVHTKRRNRLHQKKLNNLVYVMYNLKLKGKQIRKTPELEFDAVHSDDEWITEDVNENIAESVEHSHLPMNDNTNDDPNSNEFAIPSMNSNEFNMGEGGDNEFIGDPQQNLIKEEDEHVNDDDDFVGHVEPEPERNDVSDEDGEDDDVDAMKDEDI